MSVPEAPEGRSLAVPHHVLSAIALTTLEQKLLKDTNQIRKIMERLTEEVQRMGGEEKKRLRDSVGQWHAWAQRLLELAVEEE